MMWILIILGLVVIGLLAWFLTKPAQQPQANVQPTQLGNAQGPYPAPQMPYGQGGYMPPWMAGGGSSGGIDPNLQAGLGFASSLAGTAGKVLSSYFSSQGDE